MDFLEQGRWTTSRQWEVLTGSGMNKSRIRVVDSIPAFRTGIIQWLNGEPDLAGCGEADSVVSARTALAELKPDLALLDLTEDRGTDYQRKKR